MLGGGCLMFAVGCMLLVALVVCCLFVRCTLCVVRGMLLLDGYVRVLCVAVSCSVVVACCLLYVVCCCLLIVVC